MRTHELKTWPTYYAPLARGEKTFEIRKNDRDFRVGDLLVLREWCPISETYTGRQCERRVTYILNGYYAVAHPYVVMGLEAVPVDTEAEITRLRDELDAAEAELADARRIAWLALNNFHWRPDPYIGISEFEPNGTHCWTLGDIACLGPITGFPDLDFDGLDYNHDPDELRALIDKAMAQDEKQPTTGEGGRRERLESPRTGHE